METKSCLKKCNMQQFCLICPHIFNIMSPHISHWAGMFYTLQPEVMKISTELSHVWKKDKGSLTHRANWYCDMIMPAAAKHPVTFSWQVNLSFHRANYLYEWISKWMASVHNDNELSETLPGNGIPFLFASLCFVHQ